MLIQDLYYDNHTLRKFKILPKNSHTIFIIIFYSLLYTNICHSQPTLEWTKFFPDTIINNFDAASYGLCLDDSSNVYITGNAGTSTWNGYYTIKYSPTGAQLWVAIYLGQKSGGRFPHDIEVDNLHNVYVTGYSYRNGSSFDYCTIKYNSYGVQQWVSYYDSPVHLIDQARKIVIDNVGNIYVTGFSQLCMFSCDILVTIKYSKDGDVIWVRSYDSQGSTVTDLKLDDNCNVYLTGSNVDSALTIKYDSSGIQQWVKKYYSFDHNVSNSLTFDKDNNVLITGYTYPGYNYKICFTIKYSSSGVQQWVKTLVPKMNPPGYENYFYEGNSVISDNSGNIYTSGLCEDDILRYQRTFLIKYSSTGDSLWFKSSSDTAAPPFTFMDIDKNDNIYIAAIISKYQTPNQAGILKYNSSGTQIWEQVTNNLHANLNPYGIKLDDNYNIYLTGSIDTLGSIGSYMFTSKFSQTDGLENNQRKSPVSFKLYQNYPNPFNTFTKIKFDVVSKVLGKKINVKLTIYDILGREIAVPVNQYLNQGSYEIELDASNFSSGVYFYKLIIDNFDQTKKLILLK